MLKVLNLTGFDNILKYEKCRIVENCKEYKKVKYFNVIMLKSIKNIIKDSRFPSLIIIERINGNFIIEV